MYEEIMRSSRSSFFALLNVVFPEHKKGGRNNFIKSSGAQTDINNSDSDRDNEWMQEYHIIYHSYILDGTDTEQP